MYSVKELRNKITEKVLGLGVDVRFKENPAFSSVLASIDSLISQMLMFEESERVMVTEENGKISFEWTSKVDGTKYSMEIICSKPEEFRCVVVEEKRPWQSNRGQMVREKYITEEVATIDKFGFITLVSNHAMLNDIDCQRGRCNNSTSSEKMYYTSNGVMRDREYKSYNGGPLDEDITKVRVGSALYIPRQAFDYYSNWHNKYDFRTLLVRDKFDTARLVHEDKDRGIFYSGVVSLNGEHGYRDMVMLGGNFVYPADYTIEPLSLEAIDREISKESNPKVVEALRELAKGRENYHYESVNDPSFKCEGVVSKAAARK